MHNHVLLLQDVAIKVFSKQEYSEDVIFSFRQEVVCVEKLKLLFKPVIV